MAWRSRLAALPNLRLLALASTRRCHRRAQFAVGCEYPVIPRQVHARRWHQRGQACHQIQRIQHDVSLRDLMRVLSAATAVQPDPRRAIFLIKNGPIPAFRHKTLRQVVQDGRTDDAIGYSSRSAPDSSDDPR